MMDDFSLDELKLAFAYQLVHRILETDGSKVPIETRFVQKTFPADLLNRARFVQADGTYTPRYQEALGEALLRLPTELGTEERLGLIVTLWRAAVADGVFEDYEAASVAHA